MISTEILDELKKVSTARGLFAVFADWFVILACLALVSATSHPLAWFACFLVITRQQHALLVLMHEAAHRRLVASPRWNDRIAQVFASSPLFYSLDGYRHLHLLHHKKPLSKEDPDFALNGGYPVSKASFLRKMKRDVSGISYWKTMHYFASRPPESFRPSSWIAGHPMLIGLIVNALLLAGLAALGNPLAYFLLWILPQPTLLQVILRIRGVAEHSGLRENSDQRYSTRTVLPSWQTFLLAPHRVHYHVEHHLYPGVPYYRLPEIHRLIAAEIPASSLEPGYFSTFSKLIRRAPL